MAFIRFQDDSKESIRFRLMKGKMKGQAFITLPGMYCDFVLILLNILCINQNLNQRRYGINYIDIEE